MIRREATADEVHFVRQTWERSVTPKHLGRAPGGASMIHAGKAWLSPQSWAMARRHLVTELLKRPSVRVEVLDVEGVVMGWVAWEYEPAEKQTLLHFAYVPPTGRRKGLGRSLVAPLIEQGRYACSHMTDRGASLLAAVGRRAA